MLLKNHWVSDFSVGYYLSLLVFLAVCLLLNYHFNFQNNVLDQYTDQPTRMLWYFLFYGLAYYGTCLLIAYFKNKFELFQHHNFMALSLFGLIILSIESGFPLVNFITSSFSPLSCFRLCIALFIIALVL